MASKIVFLETHVMPVSEDSETRTVDASSSYGDWSSLILDTHGKTFLLGAN